ncbi:MAG: VWA domain-containing protein [Gammaproteobacteria bacterium]|nr:MAG: VWA domain-containing protein [Gammaproteobacteria bacterium]RLA46626.1 MAG: VWA domain-containing protein [Gammaproteobacteria bacterium]
MTREKRRVSTFSLSFLDIMACGFGAVTLLFLLLKHEASSDPGVGDTSLNAEASMLAEDIREGEKQKVKLRNSLQEIDDETVVAQGLSRRVLDELNERKRELSMEASPDQQIALLRKQVKQLEAETASAREEDRANDTRSFIGEGERQYLTGLKLGGQRVLILVDSSASMLAETIVNVVRRRNMSDAVQRKSAKWRRTIRTVEWLVSQLPQYSDYQIYTFNTKAKPLLSHTKGKWLQTSDTTTLDATIKHLHTIIPHDGTSLYHAFNVANGFSLRPDNIFLLTDGLPTQGQSPPQRSTVSGKLRAQYFTEALSILPKGIPVNVILFPMEGDPAAAAFFWQLGLSTSGAFLSPARDWP